MPEAITSSIPSSISSSMAVQLACARSLRHASEAFMANLAGDGLSRETLVSELFEGVASMNLSQAKSAWKGLGAFGLEALGMTESSSASSKATTLFGTWLESAKTCASWGIGDESVVEMALWLDAMGAMAGGPPEWALDVARGGKDKLGCRIGSIEIWTNLCEEPREALTFGIFEATRALARRWLTDPDEAARAHPSHWIDAAFLSKASSSLRNRSPRASAHLNFLAEIWPEFGFQPPPEVLRSIAQGWVLGSDAFCGERSAPAVAKLLSLGSAPLEPRVADRLAFMAARLNYATVLMEVARRAKTMPLSVEPSKDGNLDARGPFVGACPLILVAAAKKMPKGFRHARAESAKDHPQGLCFEALASVPEAVAEVELRGPRPDLIALAEPSLLPSLALKFPSWFAPSGEGNNFLHFACQDPAWTAGSEWVRVLWSLFSAGDEIAALFSAPDKDGIAPIESFMKAAKEQARNNSAAMPINVLQEARALAEACELRELLALSGSAESIKTSPRL